jgi:hypothetical protein
VGEANGGDGEDFEFIECFLMVFVDFLQDFQGKEYGAISPRSL